jgi:cell fate (sporulation/competence/biofilm development) regulator YlbF (YheA/YmcA/DUF963 family)
MTRKEQLFSASHATDSAFAALRCAKRLVKDFPELEAVREKLRDLQTQIAECNQAIFEAAIQ